MTNEASLIVFDLDGTLIDTATDLLDAIQYVVSREGVLDINRTELRKMVGYGGRFMLRRVFETQGKQISEEKLDQLVADFVAHYSNNMPGQSKPFEGLINSLHILSEHGYKFAVCTNKTELLANKLLHALNMDHWFELVTGQDTFAVKKPHPDHLIKTIEKAGFNPKFAVMVGDSPVDFTTAEAAMIPCIGVDFGYCEDPLEIHHIAKIISHYNELTPELIQSLIMNAKR